MQRLTHRDLYRIYLSWPEKILEGLEQELENCPGDVGEVEVRSVVIAGIGGSGAPGKILEAINMFRSNPPYIWGVSGVYIDPRVAIGESVSICVSYSGTTLETLRILEKFVRSGVRVGVVTSGGEMLRIAERRSLPLYRLKPGSLPRLELPAMMAGISKISRCLGTYLGIEPELREASSILSRDRSYIEGFGKELAEKIAGAYIAGKRVAIASTQPYYPLIHRFRSELSENASLPSEPIELPEMGHNQVASLRSGRGALVIHIVDMERGEDLAALGYFRRLSEIHPEIEVIDISPPQGASYIAKALYIAMIIGIASSALGIDRGLDPVNISEIRLFREVMYSYYSSERWDQNIL
ncbi:MAG: SIS domain-containing protein [Desulfurococcales archaeon]|jgi:glucose/mannose-6-phosphate isomerase|nr:SIS domain-containing protein [Desulfurococcales archaeon]